VTGKLATVRGQDVVLFVANAACLEAKDVVLRAISEKAIRVKAS